MALRKLRLYTGPETLSPPTSVLSEQTDSNQVRVTLGDILPLLVDAAESDRTWLNDFTDDEITITSDLHDILEAYRNFRKPVA